MTLSLYDLKKNFGNKCVLDSLSYEFEKKGVYALIGESGVGKTTLLRIIAGLDTDFTGKVIGGGFENTSFAFQEYRLFPHLSAIENAVLANGEMNDEKLREKAENLFFTLGFTEEELTKLPSELSGGMKQRVSIVRALLKDCPVLLLDEPTKELDGGLKSTLYNLIKKEGESRLVIIVTHQTEDIEHLDAVKIQL